MTVPLAEKHVSEEAQHPRHPERDAVRPIGGCVTRRQSYGLVTAVHGVLFVA
jgi:hypothetical protein